MMLSHTGICFVWCIKENKDNGIVSCKGGIQCHYFYKKENENELLD